MAIGAEESRASGTLRVGVISTVQSLDPLRAQDFVSAMVVAQIYDAPYSRPTASQDARPRLFREPLEVESEGRVYSARLRDDIRFSDGTPMTADHVVESLGRSTPFLEHADVEARGDRIAFQVRKANARFDLVLAQAFSSVVLERDEGLLGSGPYTAAPDSTAEVVRLVRNPHYDPAPKIEEVVFTCYPPAAGEPRALVAALENGEVDFCNVLQRQDVTDLQSVRKYFELGNSTAMLYFNTERPAMREVGVRKAIAHAIDRLEVASLSHENALAHVAGCLLPPMMTRWRDGIAYDLGKAKAMLMDVGSIPERLTLLLMFGPRPYLPHPRQTAEYVANRLAELRIHLDIRQAEDSQDYYRQISEGDYDLALSGWIADTVDPADFLVSVLSESAIPSLDRPLSIHANLGRYRNPAVEEALARLRRESNEEAQHEVLRMAADDMPALPLMYGSITYVHAWHVRNFMPPLLGIPQFANLELRSQSF